MADGGSWWTRKRIAIAATVLILLWLASPVGWCHETQLSYCHCGSRRWEDRRRLFSRDGVPIAFLEDVDEVRPTTALLDVFGEGHVHEWDAHSGKIAAGLWAAHYTGSAYPPALVQDYYEVDEGFRRAIRHAIHEGRLTPQEVADLLGLGANSRTRRQSMEERAAIARKGEEALRDSFFVSKEGVLAYMARYSK